MSPAAIMEQSTELVRTYEEVDAMKHLSLTEEREIEPPQYTPNHEGDEEVRMAKIAKAMKEILSVIDPCSEREGLLDTPQRCAKSLLYLTRGYQQNLGTVCNNALFSGEGDGLVVVKDIEVQSVCEHHLVPFTGKISVGYIPNGKVLGLSKVARVVDMYSRRLQIQERITRQVGDALNEMLQPRAVGVVMEASHLCMVMRGVQKTNGITRTHVFLGQFKEDTSLRQEFIQSL